MDLINNSEQIFIGIGNDKIELLGDEKIAFLADREAMNVNQANIELEIKQKRQSILDKLGITEEEAQLLLGGNK